MLNMQLVIFPDTFFGLKICPVQNKYVSLVMLENYFTKT